MNLPVGQTIEQRLAQACAELERSLRAGEACSAKELLESHEDLAANKDLSLELIYTEYIVRSELGEKPLPERWLQDFPLWRADLKELFQVHDLIAEDDFDTPAGGDTPTVGRPGFPSQMRPGACVGQYDLLEEIGRGGMGIVFKARQRGLNRLVAVKMILSADASRTDRARFRLEAEAASQLQHPNIVQIHEVRSHDGTPYMAMELVEGPNLHQQLAEHPLSPQAAATLLKTLALAIDFAHQHDIIHRDLKPANILQATDGTPKITDFGLAKQLSPVDATGDPRYTLTQTGAMLGTPSYMAPEQVDAKADQIGPATDVYALGVILYQAITGRVPFHADTPLETLNQIRWQDPLPPTRLLPKLPRDLETICLKCLEKAASQRYAGAALLAADLERFLLGQPIHARRTGPVEELLKWSRRQPVIASLIAAVVAVVLLGFAGVSWQWWRAEDLRVRAEQSTATAVSAQADTESALRAEEKQRAWAEHLLYFHEIALAYHEYSSQNILRAQQLLDDTRTDLRHWEWHYLRAQCNADAHTMTGLTEHARDVCFSSDGELVAACSGVWGIDLPGEVKVWNAGTGEEVYTLRGHASSIMSVAISPDCKVLASGGVNWRLGQSGETKLWDMATGKETHSIRNAGNVHSVAFSEDGRFLGLGGNGVRLYDTKTWEETKVFAHPSTVFSIDFSSDNTRIASGGRDGTARVWDIASGQELIVIDGLQDVRDVAFSPDGQRLAISTYGSVVKIWDVAADEEVASYQARARDTGPSAYSPDGRWLVVTGDDAIVQLWNAATGALVRKFTGHTGYVHSADFSSDGRRLATSGIDHSVKLWDLTRAEELREFAVQEAHIADMAFSPDGKQIALASTLNTSSGRGGTDRFLQLWDVDERRTVRVYQGHRDWLTSVAFSPDGMRIATGSKDKTVRIWDATEARSVFTLSGHAGEVTDVVFSPDGSRLVSSSTDEMLRFWDAATGELIRTEQAHTGGVTALAAAGQHVASAGRDGIVRIWDVTTGEDLLGFAASSDPLNALVLSDDGKHLATASDDTLIRLWDLQTGQQGEASLTPRVTLRGHYDPVRSLVFTPDGRRLASASWDQTIRLWDVASGQEVTRLHGTTERTPGVLFSPNCERLVMRHGAFLTIWDAGSKPDMNAVELAHDERQRALDWHRLQRDQAGLEGQPWAIAFHTRHEIEILKQLAAESPANTAYADRIASARSTLAFSLWKTGRTAECIEQYRLALEHDSNNPSWCNSLAWVLATCREDDLRDAAEAVALARRAVAQRWASASYRNTLGVALYRSGNSEEAAETLHASIALSHRGTASDWFYLALANAQLGNRKLAHACYFQGLPLIQTQDKESPELQQARSETEELLGEMSTTNEFVAKEPWSTVRAGFNHLAAEHADAWWVFDHRAYAHAALDRWQECADDIEKAYALYPSFHDLLVVQAGSLLMADNHDAYQTLCDDVVKRLADSPDRHHRYLQTRICLLTANSTLTSDKLISSAQEFTDHQPNNRWYLHLLALAFYRAGEYELAIQFADRSMHEAPEWSGHVTSWLVMALSHRELGNSVEMDEWKRKAETWVEANRPRFFYRDSLLHPHEWLEFMLLHRELAGP